MPRWFFALAAAGLAGGMLTSPPGAAPSRAQELLERPPQAAEPADSGRTSPDALFYYFEGNDRAFGRDPAAAVRLYRQSLDRDSSQTAVRLALARVFAALEEPDSTIYWAEQVCRRDPGSTEAFRLAGLSYLRLGMVSEGIGKLRRSTELDPSDTASFMNLLYLLESAGRYQEALSILDAADPDLRDSPALLVRRGRLLVQTGAASEAISELAGLLIANPDYPEAEMILALALSSSSAALADTGAVEALVRDRPQLERTRLALARLYLKTERYPEAQSHLEQLAARDPENPRILYDLGLLWFRQGNYEESARRFEQLQRVTPNDPEAPHWLCRIELLRGRAGEALERAGEALKRAPGDTNALLCQASAFLMAKRPKKALSAAESILRGDPTHREAGLLAAAVLDDLGRSGEAVDLLRPIVASYPVDRDVLFAFAAWLDRAGQVDSSLAVFDRILTANPDDDEAWNHSGYICIDRGIQLESGLARVGRALERSPENGAYLDSYGWGLYRLGRPDQALQWLRRAADQSPEEAEIHLHLGEVLEALNRSAEARDAYSRALRLRPRDAELRRRLQDTRRSPVGQPGAGSPASK